MYLFPYLTLQSSCKRTCRGLNGSGRDDSVPEFLRTHPGDKRRSSALAFKTVSPDGDEPRCYDRVDLRDVTLARLRRFVFGTRMNPMERNAECQTAFGMDQDCVLANSSRRLRGGYDPLASEGLSDLPNWRFLKGRRVSWSRTSKPSRRRYVRLEMSDACGWQHRAIGTTRVQVGWFF